jgi:hypothetical protein
VPDPADEGPEDGHRFHLSVSSQGSYRIVGNPQHFDTDWPGPARTITVRAWDLPAALRKAANLPLSAWAWSSDEVPDE